MPNKSTNKNNNKDKSTTKEIQDLRSQIKQLKLDLTNREARLIGMQEIINQVLSQAHVDSALLYKNINKTLTDLADIADKEITEPMQEKLQSLSRIQPYEAAALCEKFRRQESLPPLIMEDEVIMGKEEEEEEEEQEETNKS